MNNVLISILVPVYNVDKYLRVCLDSLINQSYQNIEIVLVDDGSKDGSGKICDEYAQKDTRIVVVHKENEGVVKARVTAFEHSHGELITFVDSDDYVDKQYVEKLAMPIILENCDMVSCDYYEVKNGKTKIKLPKLTGLFEKDEIRDFISNHYFYDQKCKGYGMTIFLCTKMVKRQYVESGLMAGRGLWLGEDQVSVFYMLNMCQKIRLLPDRLYYYVKYNGQATSKYNESLWSNILAILEQYEQFNLSGRFSNGLRCRTWRHINKTISLKMRKAGVGRKTFCSHMTKVRNMPYFDSFFKPFYLNALSGKRDQIKYWLLKYKFFSLFFLLFVKK